MLDFEGGIHFCQMLYLTASYVLLSNFQVSLNSKGRKILSEMPKVCQDSATPTSTELSKQSLVEP